MPRRGPLRRLRARMRGDDVFTEDWEGASPAAEDEPEDAEESAAKADAEPDSAVEEPPSAPAVPPRTVAEDPPPPEPEPEEEPEPEPEPEPRPDPYASVAPLTLGDITETRRESVARRLSALRERAPRRGGEADEREPAAEPERDRGPSRISRAKGAVGHAAAGAGQAATGVGHALAGAGHGISSAWHGVPLIARRRIAAGTILVALVALVLFVVVPAAPCQVPGGDECPPPDDAIELVPDDALAYAHADIDPESEQYGAARELAARLPVLSGFAIQGVSRELARVNLAAEIQPWAGGEIAVAVLPGALQLDRVLLVEASDEEAALAFADGLLGTKADTTEIGGVEVRTGARGAAAAIVDGFLALGDEDAVGDLIEREGTLAESGEVEDLLDDLPDERVAYAYLSGEGARALFRDPSLSTFASFVNPGATTGIAVSASVEGGLLELQALSGLDPERSESSPGFFAALPSFEPELPADVGSEALAYLGLGDPGTSVAALLDQAAADAPDLLKAVERFERGLQKKSDVDLREQVLPLLGSEAALSIQPRTVDGEATAPGTLTPSGVPYVSLIADGVDSAQAAEALARLQAPLAKALAASDGARVPGFETARLAGVDAQSLLVSPDINLTYAAFDDRLVVATSPVGVEQARASVDGLDSADAYERVTEDLPDEVSLLTFLDLGGLVSLGEEIGLASDPVYASFSTDARALDSAALAIAEEEGVLRTDLRVAVGEPVAAAEEPVAPDGVEQPVPPVGE